MDRPKMTRLIYLILTIIAFVAIGFLLSNRQNNSSDQPLPPAPAPSEVRNGGSTLGSNTDTKIETPISTGNNVKIENFKFEPAVIRVKAGQSVVFENMDSAQHSVTAENGTFDLSFTKGRSEITMSQPGTYKYYCKFHPEMTGTVIWE